MSFLKLQGDNEAGLALATEAVKKRPDLSVLYTSAQGATDGGMIALFVEKLTVPPKPLRGRTVGHGAQPEI